MTARSKFATRKIRLLGAQQLATAHAMLDNAPLDNDAPLVVTLGEETKGRGLDANALMWAGPLREIAEQAWVGGRQFSAEVWHEYFKKTYLFEADDLDLAEMVKPGYRKWDYSPGGDRVLVGSTTQLTKRGFSNYLERIFAFGGNLGVLFSVIQESHDYKK